MMNAVENGYKRALSTILDANITTLIAAIILFFMASGPVRGFYYIGYGNLYISFHCLYFHKVTNFTQR